jgi:Na+/melibiose symporter-like transporter
MGGGGPGWEQHPRHVWSPMGGAFCDPPNSTRRGVIALIIAVVVTLPIGFWAAKRERRQLGYRPCATIFFFFLFLLFIFIYFCLFSVYGAIQCRANGHRPPRLARPSAAKGLVPLKDLARQRTLKCENLKKNKKMKRKKKSKSVRCVVCFFLCEKR